MRTHPRHAYLPCSDLLYQPPSPSLTIWGALAFLVVADWKSLTLRVASPLNVFSWFRNIQTLFSSTLNFVSCFTPIPLSCNTDHLWLHSPGGAGYREESPIHCCVLLKLLLNIPTQIHEKKCVSLTLSSSYTLHYKKGQTISQFRWLILPK